MSDGDYTFCVERSPGGRVVLTPEFWPSDLDDDRRDVYEFFREEWDTTTDGGGIVPPPAVVREIGDRETVSIETLTRLTMSAVVAAFKQFRVSVLETFAPAITDLADALTPLARAGHDDSE